MIGSKVFLIDFMGYDLKIIGFQFNDNLIIMLIKVNFMFFNYQIQLLV